MIEKKKMLKEKSMKSIEDFIEYIMYEIAGPDEDYYTAITLITDNYFKLQDIRLAILGAYLVSTWIQSSENVFLEILKKDIEECDNQNKAIIYYLLAYDLYIKDIKSSIYKEYLQKSIFFSESFVNNYVRLAEVSDRKKAKLLLKQAVENVEKVWEVEQLKECPEEYFISYDVFVNEFILGVELTESKYERLNKSLRRRFYKKTIV